MGLQVYPLDNVVGNVPRREALTESLTFNFVARSRERTDVDGLPRQAAPPSAQLSPLGRHGPCYLSLVAIRTVAKG